MEKSSMEKERGQEREKLFEGGKMRSRCRVRVPDGNDAIEKEGFLHMGSKAHLPEKGEAVETDDDDIYQGKMVRTNRISDGNHDGSIMASSVQNKNPRAESSIHALNKEILPWSRSGPEPESSACNSLVSGFPIFLS
jgi:hypothetical protein